jgi:Domain of unknown function (DUF4397)
MRGTKSFLAAFVVAGLLAGCQSKQEEPIRSSSQSGTSMAPSGEQADERNMALVRFINADPNTKSVSAYMDSNVAFTDVSFKTVTPYRQVPDGNHIFHLGDRASMQAGRDTDPDVSVGREGADVNMGTDADNRDRDDVTSERESLGSGEYYTVILRPASGDERADARDERADARKDNDRDDATRAAMGLRPRIEVIKDDFGSPKDDQAQIRVINAASNPEKLDIFVRPKNDELFGNIDVNSTPSYKDVDPGNVTLEIREDGKDRALFTLPSTRMEAGKLYTFVLTNKGTNGRSLDAVLVEDQPMQRRDTQGGSDRDNDNNTNRD